MRNSEGLLDPQEEDRSQRAENRAGCSQSSIDISQKKETRGNVSEQGTTWCKKAQAASFLWKIMSYGFSTDLRWWCVGLLFQLHVDHFRDVNARMAGSVGAVSPSGMGVLGALQIELIQLSARCQDLYSGIKTSSVTSGVVLCWHGLKALRNELLLCTRAGFYGNNHLGLGQGYQI